jgi:hypothetical protein
VEDEDFAYWRCPEGTCAGGIDLRSLPQMGIPGGAAQGYGWFTYDTPAPICLSGCRHVGLLVASYNTQRIGRGVLDGLESRLGVTLTTDTAHEVLAEVLTRNGDPTGVTAHKPLLSQSIHLGGREAWKAPKNWYEAGADPLWRDLALRVKQADYALMKVEMTARGSDQYLRVADFWIEQYGFDVRTVEQRKDGTLPHETTITDDFATDTLANYTLTGTPPVGWAHEAVDERISYESDGTFTQGKATHTTSLSSANHYSKVTLHGFDGGSTSFAAVLVGYIDDDNYYRGTFENLTGNEIRFWKVLTGTPSQIGATVAGGTNGGGDEIRIDRADDSTLELFLATVSQGQRTDTTHTTGLRAGFIAQTQGSGKYIFDNFEAADLEEPAGGDRTRIWYGNVQ